MIFFIIGVLAALVALAVLLLSEEGKAAAFIPGVVAVIMIGVSCVSYVPTGYTGIVTTFGKVEDGTKDAGVVFKSPWQSIVKMDNRVQEEQRHSPSGTTELNYIPAGDPTRIAGGDFFVALRWPR